MFAIMSLGLAAAVHGQRVGTNVQEQHPQMPFSMCDASGCVQQQQSVVLDANWRWVNNGQYTNCFTGSSWDASLCPDPITCSANCHVDGVSSIQYVNTYGINTVKGRGIELDFVTGSNFGSRIYLLDNDNSYKQFHLLNREFTLTVDGSKMPCGLNGAVYFVEMARDGGMAQSGGKNLAGANYGTGYCDAQCPHDLKFVNGKANIQNAIGSCCHEMDIWEANSRATAYTAHPCQSTGLLECEGDTCANVCDKAGCDFNSYRMGDHSFFGRGSGFVVDTTKEVTVVTQFITSDGTDMGDLVEIRRFYVQDGKVIPNSNSTIAGVQGSAITDGFCNAQKEAFNDVNDFKVKGGLKAMGEALRRGMVLVMSIWDDSSSNMLWLDATSPSGSDPSVAGNVRGPCNTDSGSSNYVRAKYPSAAVKYTDLKFGSIGSTFGPSSLSANSVDSYGDNRRLSLVHV